MDAPEEMGCFHQDNRNGEGATIGKLTTALFGEI
tara:strand:- start:84 stop:185 length:102 start_codon:yes stop_codon:yes gene_type:complete